MATHGGQAIVVARDDRVRSGPHAPVWVSAAAQGPGDDQHLMTSYYWLTRGVIQLWSQSRLHPVNMDAAIICNHFTPLVLPQLEELGFCGRGEARDFIGNGHHELDGGLPCNTHNGQLAEAYLHGMNPIAEGVRLVRQQSVNQPGLVDHVLVTCRNRSARQRAHPPGLSQTSPTNTKEHSCRAQSSSMRSAPPTAAAAEPWRTTTRCTCSV